MKRYDQRSNAFRLPKSKEAQRVLAQTIGADGVALFAAVRSPAAPTWLREVPAVETLRHVWLQNYVSTREGVRWRTAKEGIPRAAQFTSSPHDPDAHLGKKGPTAWAG